MEYRILGRTGVKVSPLCLGTMTFGDGADEAESGRIFQTCRDAGINFFDCANTYAKGNSEQILGRLIAPVRDDVVITSKFGFPVGDDANRWGTSRRHMQLQVEGSLKRLNTDRIDVYFVHRFDKDTPIEETIYGLEELVRSGKILYPAISNWAAWQISKALGIQHYEGWARIQCLQPMYNLVKRQVEVEILPLAQAEGIGVIPYSPLGGGLLTGKYSTTHRPDEGRLSVNKMYTSRYGDSMNFEVAERFTDYANEQGHAPATLAVAWVASHPAVTSAIIGARSVEQLKASLAALDIAMTPEWRAEISALSPEPPPATDRSEEARK